MLFRSDVKRLNNLLCRLTRKYLFSPETDRADSFRISPNGYSYKDGAIRIVCRVPRKRIAIPLKDERVFDRQIQIHIRENSVALAVPVETGIRKHDDYINTVYVHIGYQDMFTLSNGNIYGQGLDELVSPETERLTRKNKERRKMYTVYVKSGESGDRKKADSIEANNFGRAKYDRQKEKNRLRTTDFINSEINRMLRSEKPGMVVITRPVMKNRTKYRSKSTNRKITRSFRGYIRERLAYKCRVNSIELVELHSGGTGSICSACGAEGKRQGPEFFCGNCGMKSTVSLNSARNIRNKYQNG